MNFTVLLSVIGLGISLLVSGCSNLVGNMAGAAYIDTQQENMAQFPLPSNGFQPKKRYNVTYDKIWNSTFNVLEKNRFDITLIDKANGRIATGYINGKTETMGPAGIWGTISTRYKYEIIFQKISPTKTRLGIISKLESRSLGGETDWHDISYENKQRIALLENWLYEQIENKILPVNSAKQVRKKKATKQSRAKVRTELAKGFSGKWTGTYTCSQGNTGLNLNITINSDHMDANFSFFPSQQSSMIEAGEFSLSGQFYEDGSFMLKPKAWIKCIFQTISDTDST